MQTACQVRGLQRRGKKVRVRDEGSSTNTMFPLKDISSTAEKENKAVQQLDYVGTCLPVSHISARASQPILMLLGLGITGR